MLVGRLRGERKSQSSACPCFILGTELLGSFDWATPIRRMMHVGEVRVTKLFLAIVLRRNKLQLLHARLDLSLM